MALKLKGLLSDCELLLTPLTSDQEGHLRGGFGSISVAAANNGSNRACSNASACKNDSCKNVTGGNTNCTNEACSNGTCTNDGICLAITKAPTPTKAPEAGKSIVTLCGIL